MALIIILTIAVVIFSVLAIIGNSLVLAAIGRSRRLHTTSNVYICALAIVDIYISVIHTTKYISKLFDISYIPALCILVHFMGLIGCIVNLMLIEIISLDRFYAIYWPLKYRKRCSKCFAIKNSVFVALFTTALTALALWAFGRPFDVKHCWSEELLTVPIAITANVLTCMVGLELTVMYGAMFYKAMEHQKSLQLGYFNRNNKDASIFDIKALKTCSIVLGAFFLMWVPPLITINLAVFSKARKYVRVTTNICMILPTINSSLDPIVYAIMRKDIRKGLQKLFPICLKKKQMTIQEPDLHLTDTT